MANYILSSNNMYYKVIHQLHDMCNIFMSKYNNYITNIFSIYVFTC